MKIGIDTFACDSGKSGVGVYIRQLLKRAFPAIEGIELFGWDYDRFVFNETAPDIPFVSRCKISTDAANALWHLARYPQFSRDRGYDVCFFPAAHKRLPLSSPCPSVGVVHDMAAFWRNLKTREHLGLFRAFFPRALRNLDRIIAVSSWVKQGLIEIARVQESRIIVIPNGVDRDSFHPRPQNEESVLHIQPFSFQQPYILYTSRIDHPVKNHLRLIKAFELFKNKTRFPHRLILAGPDSYGAKGVKKAALESPVGSDIFFTGHFPASSLPELYAGADMAVFPSLYEGFGLGVLEAMASGVPVACARTASLPETAGDAALYFDPLDPEEMADKMTILALNPEILQECRDRGLERVKDYSWERCAELTLETIRETGGAQTGA